MEPSVAIGQSKALSVLLSLRISKTYHLQILGEFCGCLWEVLTLKCIGQ